jgi:hypothetical protein
MVNDNKSDKVIGVVKMETYQVELLPFGLNFRESAPIVNGKEFGTSASVTVTGGPDTDTDAPD